MKRSILVLCGLSVCAGDAQAFERNAWRDLDVAVEELSGPMSVDGLAMSVLRAVGSDVPELVRRIGARWHKESDADRIRALAHEQWSILSRIHLGNSEVMQWRGSGEQAELLWSTTDLRQRPGSLPQRAVTMPAGCFWNRSVHGQEHGREYLQSNARCSLSSDHVLRTLISELQREQWSVRSTGGNLIVANRGRMAVRIAIAPLTRAARGAGASVVLLQVATPEGLP
jgi:hypothetical protein